jgi:predicted kinase
MNKVLFIVRGLPGSGKSTLAKMLCPIDSICEADKYFNKDGVYNFDASLLKEAHQWCKKEVESKMQMDEPRIVVSNTFTTEWEMVPYFELAEKWGYSAMTMIVENRHGSSNVHGVPEQTIEKMRSRFDIKL